MQSNQFGGSVTHLIFDRGLVPTLNSLRSLSHFFFIFLFFQTSLSTKKKTAKGDLWFMEINASVEKKGFESEPTASVLQDSVSVPPNQVIVDPSSHPHHSQERQHQQLQEQQEQEHHPTSPVTSSAFYPSYDSSFYAPPPSPGFDYSRHSQHQYQQHQYQYQQGQHPHYQQQRAYSVTTMPTELQKSVLRHQQHLQEQQRQQLMADQPWWQYYYQLYHYHPPPGRKPTVFGPYLLLQTLGEGEFGKVKLGIHIDSGQEVCHLQHLYSHIHVFLFLLLTRGLPFFLNKRLPSNSSKKTISTHPRA